MINFKVPFKPSLTCTHYFYISALSRGHHQVILFYFRMNENQSLHTKPKLSAVLTIKAYLKVNRLEMN